MRAPQVIIDCDVAYKAQIDFHHWSVRQLGGPHSLAMTAIFVIAHRAMKSGRTAIAVGIWILTGLQCRWAPYDRDHDLGQGQLPVSTLRPLGIANLTRGAVPSKAIIGPMARESYRREKRRRFRLAPIAP